MDALIIFLEENIEDDPPFGYPASSDKLINSVINLLSLESKNNESVKHNQGAENEELSKCEVGEGNEDVEGAEIAVRSTVTRGSNDITENVDFSVEKDSLDGSPHSRRSFTQEEDDSGISLVDENDIVQESSLSNVGHFEGKKEHQVEKNGEEISYTSDVRSTERTNSEKMCDSKAECNEFGLTFSEPNESEPNCSKSSESRGNLSASSGFESNRSIEWQTRHKRASKKNREFEKTGYCHQGTNSSERSSSDKEPRRSGLKSKGSQGRTESYSKVADKNAEDRHHKERNFCGNSWAEDVEIRGSPKRSGRRAALAGKKSDNKYTKNGSKEKHSDLEKHHAKVQSAKVNLLQQPSVFSYRDALLKAGSKGR